MSPTRAGKQVSEVLVTTIGVGVAQMVARPGELEGNLATAEMLLREMVGQGAQIVVLPELFATSYDIEQAAAMVRHEVELVLPRLTSLAATLGLTIATTVLAGDGRDGTLCNLAVVIDRRGVIATAGKQMLWAGESAIFAPDHGPRALVRSSGAAIGVAVCYEAGFPELTRELAVRGADIISVPAAFGASRRYAWDLLTRSRAVENGCFVLAAGLADPEDASVPRFSGHSRIVDPRGQILAELADGEGVLTARIDLSDIASARTEIPYLAALSARQTKADSPAALTHPITTGK